MNKVQRYYVIISLCLLAGMKLSAYDEGEVGESGGFEIISLLVEASGIALLLLFTALNWSTIKAHLRLLTSPFSLVLLLFLSTAWSIDPTFTFRRSIVFACATFFAYHLGVLFPPKELLRFYRTAFLSMMFISLVVVVLLPRYGIAHGAHGGDWKGAFYHKNRFGEIMAMTVMTVALAPTDRIRKLRRWFFIALGFALLYKAHSTTSLAALMIILLLQAAWPFLRLKKKSLVGLSLAGYPLVAVALGVIATTAGSLFALFGKDSSFSGRDRLWAGELDAIKLKPLLGYGYLTFWHQQGGYLTLISLHTNFVPPQGHNGYLDLLLHVGVVGLLLYLVIYFKSMWFAAGEVRRIYTAESKWFLSFVLIMGIINLTESQVVEPFFFLWVTLTAFTTSFAVARSAPYEGEETEERFAADQSALMSVAS